MWIREYAEPGAFERLQNIDRYYRKFVTQSDYLITQNEILQRDVNLLFSEGIPDAIRKKVRKRLPVADQKISNPPDVDVTLDLLRQESDETDIDAVVNNVDLEALNRQVQSPSRIWPLGGHNGVRYARLGVWVVVTQVSRLPELIRTVLGTLSVTY
jgi:hypothetical protein